MAYSAYDKRPRLECYSRGAPPHVYSHAVDSWLPALFGLFSALTMIAYISQIVP